VAKPEAAEVTEPDRLAPVAWLLSQDENNPAARAQFEALLAKAAEVPPLLEFAQRYGPFPAVSIPLLKRCVELQPEEIANQVALGFAYWMNGMDEEAQACATRALEMNRQSVDALNLQAALAKDDETKRRIYARILTIDPKNRAAFDNLVLLRG